MALVHCRECGEMISETAPICPKCGAKQNISSSSSIAEDQDPNIGLNIVSFIWPLVGLIFYFVYKEGSPRRAKECGKWALIGFLVGVGLTVIILLIYFVMIAALI